MGRALTLLASVAFLLGGSSSAGAAVTVGQVAPGAITSCSNSFDFLQISTPGDLYSMPAAGTITSWTHKSQTGDGQTPTLKIFRKTGEPATYQVAGHDGPEAIAANSIRTFQASIPVKAGDVLGITGAGGAANIGCYFQGEPGVEGFRMGNLGDGGFGNFTIGGPNRRLNVSAVLNPTNTLTFGSTTRNKKKGNATLTVNVPNPGTLTPSGAGAKVAGPTTVSGPGAVKLTVSAKGKKRKALGRTGKAKVSIAIGYTPTGGDLSSQTRKLTLKKTI